MSIKSELSCQSITYVPTDRQTDKIAALKTSKGLDSLALIIVHVRVHCRSFELLSMYIVQGYNVAVFYSCYD